MGTGNGPGRPYDIWSAVGLSNHATKSTKYTKSTKMIILFSCVSGFRVFRGGTSGPGKCVFVSLVAKSLTLTRASGTPSTARHRRVRVREVCTRSWRAPAGTRGQEAAGAAV